MSSRRSFICANPDCKMSLLDLCATRPQDEPGPDDIIVCGACRIPSVITPISTRLMTELEADKLPPEVREEIRFALRALDAKLKTN